MNWVVQNKDLAEALSYWATALGIVLAVAAGGLAAIRYFLDRRHEHWQRADALYGEFLDCALTYPQFSGANWAGTVENDPILRNQYSYFVGKFLWICEQIINGKAYDAEWRDCLKIIMREHRDYLRTDYFAVEKPAYERSIIELIDEVLAEDEALAGVKSNA